MSINAFIELDNKFITIQKYLENGTEEGSYMNQIFKQIIRQDRLDVMKKANSELIQIRNFYNYRFNAASGKDKDIVLEKYQEVYNICSHITHNNLTVDEAAKRIKINVAEWGADIMFNNIIHFCLAVACALPLVAGIVVLPFVLPVISLDFFFGAAIFTVASSSILLAVTSCLNHLAALESTKTIKKNSIVELSFLNNFSGFVHMGEKKHVTSEASDDEEVNELDDQTAQGTLVHQ